MTKETYETLELKIVKFDTEDVILMSGLDNEDNEGDVDGINPDLGGDDLG